MQCANVTAILNFKGRAGEYMEIIKIVQYSTVYCGQMNNYVSVIIIFF